VTITPSTGTFEEGDELTCSANGYKPTYTWTGTAGVNGTIVSATGDIYTLPEGPFNVTCRANVSQLSAPCHIMSATASDNAYSKYESKYNNSNNIHRKTNHNHLKLYTTPVEDSNKSFLKHKTLCIKIESYFLVIG